MIRDPRASDDPEGRIRGLLEDARGQIDNGQPDAALPLLEEAVRLAPASGDAHCELGRALNNLRRLPQARAVLEEATRLSPCSAIAWNRLGHVCRALGDPGSAEPAFRRAVDLDPDFPAALANLASAHLARGDADTGVGLLQRAVKADPGDPGTRAKLGDALQGLGRLNEADAAYREALSIDPNHVPALAGLGTLLSALGNYRPAENILGRALKAQPADPVAIASLAHVLELQGRNQEVLSLMENAPWSRPPEWATVTTARQLFRLGRREAAAARLDGLDQTSMDWRSRTAALNLRGRILEADGDYDSAFLAFRDANRVRPSEFSPEEFTATVDRLIRFFTRDRLATLPGAGCSSDRPVFIVGMPRSGSSLVEQILASHTRVHACGERTDLYALPRRLADGAPADRWPECLAEADTGTLIQAALAYLEAEVTPGPGTSRSTDKLPANFLNLGLIQLLFPRARVIYCRRDPLDVGLSCFQQDFQSPGMSFARDLGHIGLYQQGCSRLMRHWNEVLDLQMHAVDYEDLVAETEREARRLVRFVGLEWEDRCLQFHESDRVVRTASHEQVRRPIYASSVGRWRRYARWLGPLRMALDAPWPDRIAPEGR
jgi:Flp pilus assembly protein TadD